MSQRAKQKEVPATLATQPNAHIWHPSKRDKEVNAERLRRVRALVY